MYCTVQLNSRTNFNKFLFSEGRDKIIFKNVLKIINFHRKYFTVAIREAEGCSAKILNLFQSKHEEMKTFYGKFCIDFKKAEYLIKNFSEYIVELEKIAETEIHLQDLFLRYIKSTDLRDL